MDRKISYHPGYKVHGSELLIVILLICGISLLVSEIALQQLLQEFGEITSDAIHSIETTFNALVIEPISQLETSDSVGLLLLTISFGLILRQVRSYMVVTFFDSTTCPECGHKLHRYHRTRLQHMITRFMLLDSVLLKCSGCSHTSFRFFRRAPRQSLN
jgi:hypothetical protein